MNVIGHYKQKIRQDISRKQTNTGPNKTTPLPFDRY